MPDDREKDSKVSKQSPKVKDLSHVPCKFFKVGACTAGSSCPFSHVLPEPGAHKEACAWFIKGNCKFAHKCALAHVLPGQPMSMDRKNKKAAQLAANTTNNINIQPKDPQKSAKSQKKDPKPSSGTLGSSSSSSPSLLSGSTAPTRVLQSSARPPLPVPLKASISPSAPAPSLKDTDFTFGLPDEDTPPPPIESNPQPTQDTEPSTTTTTTEKKSPISSQPLPLSNPSAPRRLGLNLQASPPIDFGPIGSPPRSMASTGKLPRINGGGVGNGPSPSTSPSFNHHPFSNPSPFSAPGTQTVFDSSSTEIKSRSGIAASLGANRSWMPEFTSMRNSTTTLHIDADVVVDDEDLEDFLPSSLTDLLTVEERSRRMSRSNSGQRGITITRDPPNARGTNIDGAHHQHQHHQHRYSRSVPAPSLLSDIQSIWSDPVPISSDLSNNNNNNNASGSLSLSVSVNSSHRQPHALGTPSSFNKSTTHHHAFGGRSFSNTTTTTTTATSSTQQHTADDVFVPVVPSNASAAFLPGLHHHYLSAKAAAAATAGSSSGGGGGAGSGLVHGVTRSGNVFAAAGMTLSPPHLHAIAGRSSSTLGSGDHHHHHHHYHPHHLQQHNHYHHGGGGGGLMMAGGQSGRPIPGNVNNNNNSGGEGEERSALSPSTRALQAHAPGQSLPQGLAAGLSRIHVQPPPPSSVSGKQGLYMSSSSSSSMSLSAHGNGNGQEWDGRASVVVSPGMGRTSARGGGVQQGHGTFSPLSGPVLGGGDDDDLFAMDG